MKPKHLVESADAYHEGLVIRTEIAIRTLQAHGKRISFYAVSKEANVPRSTLYRCDDLKELVVAARERAQNAPDSPRGEGDPYQRIAELEQRLAEVTSERDALARQTRTAIRANRASTDC